MSEPVIVTFPEELVERITRQIADLVAERLTAATDSASPWLDVEAACRYLGFSRDKLYKLAAARAFPVRKKENGQGLLFHRDELDAWARKAYPRVDRLG